MPLSFLFYGKVDVVQYYCIAIGKAYITKFNRLFERNKFLPLTLSSTVTGVFNTSSIRIIAAEPFCILLNEVDKDLTGLIIL